MVARAVAAGALRRRDHPPSLALASHHVKRGIASRMNPAHFVAFYIVLPLFVGLLVLQLALWLLG